MSEPRVSNVTNAELRTIRDAMRDLNRMVEALAGGQAEKFVLTHRNQMRAVVVSLDRYSQLEQAATETGT